MTRRRTRRSTDVAANSEKAEVALADRHPAVGRQCPAHGGRGEPAPTPPPSVKWPKRSRPQPPWRPPWRRSWQTGAGCRGGWLRSADSRQIIVGRRVWVGGIWRRGHPSLGSKLSNSERLRSARVEAVTRGVGVAAGVTSDAIERAAHVAAWLRISRLPLAEEQAMAYVKTGKIGSEILVDLAPGSAPTICRCDGARGGRRREGSWRGGFSDPKKGAEEQPGLLGHPDPRANQAYRKAREGDLLGGANANSMRPIDGSTDTTAVHVRGLAGVWNTVRNAASDGYRAIASAGVANQKSAADQIFQACRKCRRREGYGGVNLARHATNTARPQDCGGFKRNTARNKRLRENAPRQCRGPTQGR